MNDMQSGELGDPAPSQKKKGRRVGAKKPGKVVPFKKGSERKTAPEDDPDFEQQMASEQEGRNSRGIEGRERAYDTFLIEATAHKRQVARLNLAFSKKVDAAKKAGVSTRDVNRIAKELAKVPDELIEEHNRMNELRRRYHLPAFDVHLEAESSYKSDEQRDEIAAREGIRAAWRGASERDCPYPDDQDRGQAWIAAYRAEDAKIRELVSAATIRNLAPLAQKATAE